MSNERPETFAIIPEFPEELTELNVYSKTRGFNTYGILLSDDPNHNISQVIDKYWNEIHELTGKKFLFATNQVPSKWNEYYKNDLKEILGDAYDQKMEKWKNGVKPGLVFDFLKKFNDTEITLSQLPCLVVFTNPDTPKAVIRNIPNWEVDYLYKFIKGVLWTIRECSEAQDKSDDERLELLEETLKYPTADAEAYYDYAKDRVLDYIKKNPAEIIKTGFSFVAALATGNLLPLSDTAIKIIKILKDTIFK